MKRCRHCDAQFPDEFEQCVHCHRALVGSRQARARALPDLSELYPLATEHPSTVSGLLDRLRDADISFTLVTDGGIRKVDRQRGSAGHQARARVFVDPDEAPRAEAVYREFLEALTPHVAEMGLGGSPPPDACPACHAPITRMDESCPSCDLAFPPAEN